MLSVNSEPRVKHQYYATNTIRCNMIFFSTHLTVTISDLQNKQRQLLAFICQAVAAVRWCLAAPKQRHCGVLYQPLQLTMHGSLFLYYIADKTAILHWGMDGKCPSVPSYLVPNNRSEVTEVLHDSDLTTCISPANETAGSSFSVVFTLSVEKTSVNFRVLGNHIQCSPAIGMRALGVGSCNGTHCDTTPCSTSDLGNISVQHVVGCKYRCRCYSECTAMIVMFADVSSSWEICEILIWLARTVRVRRR